MSKYQLNPASVSLYAEKIMLKVMLEHKVFNDIFHKDEWRDEDVARALGVPEEMNNKKGIRSAIRGLLEERYQILQNLTALPAEIMQQAYENVEKLAGFIGLNEAEKAILIFMFHFRVERPLLDVLYNIPKLDLRRLIPLLSDLLNLKEKEIKNALNLKEKLVSYGLISRNYSPDSLTDYLGWGDTLDFDDFTTQPLDELSLLSRCAVKTPPSTLALSQFDHIDEMRTMMLCYLKETFNTKRKGVNFLIYGLPGTGKTELAALLAETLSIPSYSINYMDKDGDLLSGSKRLENCRLAHTLLSDKSAMVIFDEIEDVFSASLFKRSVAQEHKAWVNQLLENNTNPMIWISNSVDGIDPAFLRRFDFIFEMPNLPIKNKAKLIKEKANERLNDDYIQLFAQTESLTPAMITRSLDVISALNTPKKEFAQRVLTVLNQNLLAQGKKKIEPPPSHKLSYNLNWVSCNDDIHQISQGLMQTKSGRICCYGPPGTGKTAWAAWLAEQLDMPLLVRQGSDLLGKYVGETEQKIAAAFSQAKENEMVLVLDEVDSFLFSLDEGQRSWERSQVNEMLTQIERFDGLMIVSTNLMNILDPAALRRFDLKLKFDYLSCEQGVWVGD